MGKLLEYPDSLDRKSHFSEQQSAANPSVFVGRCAELSGSIVSLEHVLTTFQASVNNFLSRHDRLKLRARKSENPDPDRAGSRAAVQNIFLSPSDDFRYVFRIPIAVFTVV